MRGSLTKIDDQNLFECFKSNTNIYLAVQLVGTCKGRGLNCKRAQTSKGSEKFRNQTLQKVGKYEIPFK